MTANGKRTAAATALICALASPCVTYYEGYVPHSYADPVGITTACYGNTGYDIQSGKTYTKSQCDKMLTDGLRRALDDVDHCIGIGTSPPQAAALVSFTYNVGRNKLCNSTLARLANEGAAPEVWCAQMLRWTYATKFGVTLELPGLVKRRNAEFHMCLGQDWQQP